MGFVQKKIYKRFDSRSIDKHYSKIKIHHINLYNEVIFALSNPKLYWNKNLV